MANFDLLKNPFVLLGVSTRDGGEAIAEALEDRLAEGEIDEEDLLRAQQVLMASRSRLQVEMGWLIGMAPSRVKGVIAALEGNDEEAIEQVLGDSNAVARGNIAASLAAASGTKINVLHHLFRAQVEIEPDYITETINADRRIAGFPEVARDLVEQTLETLKEQHCIAALAAVTGAPHPGKRMTSLVESVLPAKGPIRDFLEMVGERYDRWSGPTLRRIEDEIAETAEKLRKNTGDAVALRLIETKLDEWDDYSQPRQLIYDAKGLDEPRSKAIYEKLRDLTLWLANENQCFQQALTISKALLKTFPELPTVLDQASDDIETLEGLVQQAEQTEIFGPLIAILEKVNNDVFAFAQSVDSGEFAPDRSGIAGQLYQAFAESAKDVQDDPEHADLPWLMTRQLLIDLHNEQEETRVALKVLRGVISHRGARPSDEMRVRLEGDQETLERVAVTLDMTDDVKAERWAEAIAKIASLEDTTTDPQERRDLEQMRKRAERRKNARRNKLVGWGLVAAIIIGFLVINNQNSKPSRSPSTTTSSAVGRDEMKPPVSSNRVLSRAELRWCRFQSARLDALRPLLNTDRETDRFNTLIDDLNARCSNNKYYERDHDVIDPELTEERSRLQREGRALLNTSTLQGAPSD